MIPTIDQDHVTAPRVAQNPLWVGFPLGTGPYFTRILRLSFLAPEVVKTILRDRHPLELTAKKLAGDTRLPIAWEEQRTRLGIT